MCKKHIYMNSGTKFLIWSFAKINTMEESVLYNNSLKQNNKILS